MKKIAPLLVLLAGILWGCMGLFVRRLNVLGLAAMQIVQLRALTASILLIGYAIVRDREQLRIRRKDLWCFLGTGICSILFFNFCYFQAMELTSLSVAAVLLYTAPIWVMLISRVLFGEVITARSVLALVLTFTGCALAVGVLDGGNRVSTAGVLAGLGAGLGYALYSIFGRYALKRGYSSLTITIYTFFIAFLGSLPLTRLPVVVDVGFADGASACLSIGLGVVCTILPFLFYTIGLTHIENSKASILASIEPVTATLLGVVVFQERLSLTGAIGVALVVVGLSVCSGQTKPEAETDQG